MSLLINTRIQIPFRVGGTPKNLGGGVRACGCVVGPSERWCPLGPQPSPRGCLRPLESSSQLSDCPRADPIAGGAELHWAQAPPPPGRELNRRRGSGEGVAAQVARGGRAPQAASSPPRPGSKKVCPRPSATVTWGWGTRCRCAVPARSHLACRKEAPGCAPWPPAAPGCCRLRTAASMAALPQAGPSALLSRVTEGLGWPGGGDKYDARGRARAGRLESAQPEARAETGPGGGAGGGGTRRE